MVGVKYYVAGYIKAVQNWAHEVIQLYKLLYKFVKMVVSFICLVSASIYPTLQKFKSI